MENLTELLKYVLPSMVVLATAYLMLKLFFESERNKRNQEYLIERIRISLPVRLQAYERIILFLERISPQNLVMRLHKPEFSAAAFHRELLHTVREEFTHNLSQQLYVSLKAWELVKGSKEEVVRQINTSFSQLDEQATATDLSNKLLEISSEKLSVSNTLDYLKSEAAKAF